MRLKCLTIFLSGLALCTAPALAARKNTTRAKDAVSAPLFTQSGREVGRALIVQAGRVLRLSMHVKGQTPGEHALHIHTEGLCTPPDFAAAGPHWNPSGRQHGLKNRMGPHAGDIINISIDDKGYGKLHTDIGPGTLFGSKDALIDRDGASIILHEKPDDFATDPSGNSGGRIVCGVFAREGKSE